MREAAHATDGTPCWCDPIVERWDLSDEQIVAGFLQRNCAMTYDWCVELARRLLVALETRDMDS